MLAGIKTAPSVIEELRKGLPVFMKLQMRQR